MARTKTTDLVKAEIMPTLPGIQQVDQQLLTQTIKDLNSLYTAKSVDTACAIGTYLLESYFDGNMESFNQWGGKHQTFAELLKIAHSDDSPLHISASGLWYSVRILEQVQALPEAIAKALPITHHRMLVPVKDTKTKLRLAEVAVSKSTPSRDFQDEIRKAREKERGPVSSGRPPLPIWAKALKQSVKAVKKIAISSVTKGSFDFFDADNAKALLAEVDMAVEKIQKLQAKIKEQVDKMAE